MWTVIKKGFNLLGRTIVRHPFASFIFAWAVSETAYPVKVNIQSNKPTHSNKSVEVLDSGNDDEVEEAEDDASSED